MPVSLNKTENGDPPGDQGFEEIEIAEEELIDGYVRDELSADERRLLEKGLRSSPEMVDRLYFARLLADAADRTGQAELTSVRDEPQQRSRRSWWPFQFTWLSPPAFNLAFAAAVLIIFVGGAGLLTAWINLRRQTQSLADQRAAVEQQKLELEKSAAEQRLVTEQTTAALKEKQQKLEADQQRLDELIKAQTEKLNGSAASIVPLFLTPSLRGSPDAPKEFSPPPGSKIKLQLAITAIGYRQFVAEITNSQGKVVSKRKVNAPRSGSVVTFTIPSQALPADTYTVQLSGISSGATPEPVSNFSFRITPTGSNQR